MWWNISHFLFLCGAYNEFSETDCCDLELRISFFPLGFDRLRKFLLVMSAGTQYLIATPDSGWVNLGSSEELRRVYVQRIASGARRSSPSFVPSSALPLAGVSPVASVAEEKAFSREQQEISLCLFLHFSSPLPLFFFSFRESLLSCDLRFGHIRDSRRGDSGRERRDFFLSLDFRRRLRQQCRSRRGKGTPWRTPRPCMGIRDTVRCLFTWAQACSEAMPFPRCSSSSALPSEGVSAPRITVSAVGALWARHTSSSSPSRWNAAACDAAQSSRGKRIASTHQLTERSAERLKKKRSLRTAGGLACFVSHLVGIRRCHLGLWKLQPLHRLCTRGGERGFLRRDRSKLPSFSCTYTCRACAGDCRLVRGRRRLEGSSRERLHSAVVTVECGDLREGEVERKLEQSGVESSEKTAFVRFYTGTRELEQATGKTFLACLRKNGNDTTRQKALGPF
ncbi:hypothetical protein TGMAS_245748 [Toxoplasma gondii MAS]|uniref:Uncharacterized protein n=2 Tax=Toxoplasma gondii TaxID=5811 RepID=A0A086PV55_TOXGO|nr:hypothetical protein TGMAS_245748 [Toxoplasma gondii MAS]PUA90465.1 hypothetical protein TGBR9_245748 [Toxoplasma gondii TgCATBr9]